MNKSVFDGAGRTLRSYSTDGGAGSGWSNASTVTGDNVLEESIATYDSNGNAIFTVLKQHNHDDTNTGELGDVTTTPKARVYYSATYFDAANRPTGMVNAGTYNGSAYTRASSLPTPSDTLLVSSVTYNPAGWTDTATDPRGIVTATYYDMMGRTIRRIEAYDGVIPPVIGTLPAVTSSTDRATTWVYDGLSHIYQLTAVMPSGTNSQTTQYNYGVATSGSSAINSNDLLASVQYPDKTAGTPGTNASDKQTYVLNAIGQQTSYVDQNGTTHAYVYDLLGRRISDAVTVASGNPQAVDTSVLRQAINFDTGDRPYQLTQYNAASGGSVVNQIQDGYNGLGQLTGEYQEHSGSVNTSTSLQVQYGYTLMASGVNNSRQTSMTYPNGRVLTYGYSNVTVDGVISRVDFLAGSGGDQTESYQYLGLSAIVYSQRVTDTGGNAEYWTYITGGTGDGGDQYVGLDRFGRVVDKEYVRNHAGTTINDRFQYGYDRAGNALYKNNLVLSSLSELYHANSAASGDNATAYDKLNRLTGFTRGTLSSSGNNGSSLDTISTASSLSSHAENWTLDALGNWASQTIDGTATSRTHDSVNEVTAVGTNSLTFDNNGNTTKDQAGQTYIYDAWNRLIQAKNSSAVTLATYVYDAHGWRIKEVAAATTDVYFSHQWQALEDRQGTTVINQYVWGLQYIDELVEFTDTTIYPYFVNQDANWNATTVVGGIGVVQGRFAYDPYGNVQALTADGGSTTDTHSLKYRHQGGRLDSATRLYNFRSRNYAATLGRWMERDSAIYIDGQNLYQADDSNPGMITDFAGTDGVSTSYSNTLTWRGESNGQQGTFYQTEYYNRSWTNLWIGKYDYSLGPQTFVADKDDEVAAAGMGDEPLAGSRALNRAGEAIHNVAVLTKDVTETAVSAAMMTVPGPEDFIVGKAIEKLAPLGVRAVFKAGRWLFESPEGVQLEGDAAAAAAKKFRQLIDAERADNAIATHALSGAHCEWKGKTVADMSGIIKNVRDNFQEAYDLEGGGKIYRKGDTVLIEDGKGGGTILQPPGSAADYVHRRAKSR